MSNIKIVSKGTPDTTSLLIDDKLVGNISCIKIHPIDVNTNIVTASVTFVGVELDLENIGVIKDDPV